MDGRRQAAEHEEAGDARQRRRGRSARRIRRSRRRRGRRSPPASTPASTTSTTFSSATRSTYLPDLGMVHSRATALHPQLHSGLEAGRAVDSRRHLVLGHGRQRRRPLEHADGAGDVSAGRRAERRAALRPPAPRHPRHDGDVLLLRHRSEPLRGRQHRVRRHPEAARLRRRHRADRAGRSAQPDRASSSCASARELAAVAPATPTR